MAYFSAAAGRCRFRRNDRYGLFDGFQNSSSVFDVSLSISALSLSASVSASLLAMPSSFCVSKPVIAISALAVSSTGTAAASAPMSVSSRSLPLYRAGLNVHLAAVRRLQNKRHLRFCLRKLSNRTILCCRYIFNRLQKLISIQRRFRFR